MGISVWSCVSGLLWHATIVIIIARESRIYFIVICLSELLSFVIINENEKFCNSLIAFLSSRHLNKLCDCGKSNMAITGCKLFQNSKELSQKIKFCSWYLDYKKTRSPAIFRAPQNMMVTKKAPRWRGAIIIWYKIN